MPLHLVLQRAPAIARLSRDGRWRRGELHYSSLLKLSKLLILRYAQYAKNAQSASRRYTAGTRRLQVMRSRSSAPPICFLEYGFRLCEDAGTIAFQQEWLAAPVSSILKWSVCCSTLLPCHTHTLCMSDRSFSGSFVNSEKS